MNNETATRIGAKAVDAAYDAAQEENRTIDRIAVTLELHPDDGQELEMATVARGVHDTHQVLSVLIAHAYHVAHDAGLALQILPNVPPE